MACYLFLLAGLNTTLIMKIHYLQHVPFQSPGIITFWAAERGCRVGSTLLYDKGKLPDPSSVDALIVLGGTMNVYEEDQYPWLVEEKELIRQCIRQKKKVLGINLGAQLIADVLGAGVYPNRVKEIGWHLISWNSCAWSNPMFNFVPCHQITLHWHRDTFDLPAGAERLASSRCCKNQAFTWQEHVVGLQFHLEVVKQDLEQLIAYHKEELKERGPHMQSAEHLLSRPNYIEENNHTMFQLMDRFFLEKYKTTPQPAGAGMHY